MRSTVPKKYRRCEVHRSKKRLVAKFCGSCFRMELSYHQKRSAKLLRELFPVIMGVSE